MSRRRAAAYARRVVTSSSTASAAKPRWVTQPPNEFLGDRPGAAGQDPGGLPGRAVGHVLRRRGDDHRVAEHGRGDTAQRLGLGPAADEHHPLDPDALGHQRVQAVGEAAQQPLDGRPGQAGRGGVGQPEPVQGPGGVRVVGGALTLQVGDQGEPAGPRRGAQGQLRQPPVVDAEQGRGGVQHPGGVEGADQRQEPAGGIREAGHDAAGIRGSGVVDGEDGAAGADRDDQVPRLCADTEGGGHVVAGSGA